MKRVQLLTGEATRTVELRSDCIEDIDRRPEDGPYHWKCSYLDLDPTWQVRSFRPGTTVPTRKAPVPALEYFAERIAKAKATAEFVEKRRIEREAYKASILNVAELKERGWTDTAIEQFLGEADQRVEDPHHKSGPGIRYWMKSRVLAAETSDAYLAWEEGSNKRREAAEKGVQTRIANMEDRILAADITIDGSYTIDALRSLAAETHGGNYEGDAGELRWDYRGAVNCIRHNLTNYERLWRFINRGATGGNAYLVLRGRVDDLIEQTYGAMLSEEFRR